MSNINTDNMKCSHWIWFFLSLFIFILVTKSTVSHTGSDARAGLLLSQVLIEDQSIKLDKYKDSNYGTAIYKKNNHYYYRFPLGTSISSIPFVWFETRLLNHDMNNRAQDKVAQKFIAGIIAVLIFLLLYLIARMYLSSGLSIIVALSFWLGTSFSSTLGQALWSQNFSSLYTLLAIFLILIITKENKDKYWVLLGVTLFMAYLTRPTLSLLSITVISYLFFNHKKYIAIKTASVVGLLLGIFILFSLYEFNQLLPDYYLPKRLSSEDFWIAFYGNLLSPARGLLIFSPFLFLFLLNAKDTYKLFKNDKTLIIIVSWIFLHLIIISKFPHWWAGYSYGSRFMVDVLPAIYLLFVILLVYSYKTQFLVKKRSISVFLVITILLSIYFNAIQGLYNHYSGSVWNGSPSIDKNPHYLFDWKYPQFLYNKERHAKRLKEFNDDQKHAIKFTSKNIIYRYGWSHFEKNHIWSLGKKSELAIKLEAKKYRGQFTLKAKVLGEQKIKIYINNILIGKEQTVKIYYPIRINFDSNLLKPDELNTIKFEYSNPHKPNNGDKRVLAMALKSFKIE